MTVALQDSRVAIADYFPGKSGASTLLVKHHFHCITCSRYQLTAGRDLINGVYSGSHNAGSTRQDQAGCHNQDQTECQKTGLQHANTSFGLFYRAFLRAATATSKWDTRMAIGVGTVDFVPEDRISKGDGQAYRCSGKALEEMTKASNMCFRFPGTEMEESLDVLVHLLDVLAMNWTQKQALAIIGALQGLRQEEIGTLWKPSVSQQAVNRHLQRAGWFAIEKAIGFFEKQLREAVI